MSRYFAVKEVLDSRSVGLGREYLLDWESSRVFVSSLTPGLAADIRTGYKVKRVIERRGKKVHVAWIPTWEPTTSLTPALIKSYKPNTKKRKIQNGEEAPQGALSAFFWFCNDEREDLVRENPHLNLIKQDNFLVKMWRASSADVKKKYEAMAAQDKARYEREMMAYKGKKGKGAPVQQVEEDDDDEEEEKDSDE